MQKFTGRNFILRYHAKSTLAKVIYGLHIAYLFVAGRSLENTHVGWFGYAEVEMNAALNKQNHF